MSKKANRPMRALILAGVLSLAAASAAQATDGPGKPVDVMPDPNGPLLARVFKTTADPFVGRLTFFRVYSGKIASHDHVWNSSRGEEERIR